MFSDVLNPVLFAGLTRYFGQDQVEVVSHGEAMQWETQWVNTPGRSDLVPVRRVLDAGEEYRVRCDQCHDSRARLYINHRWGVFDEETKSRNFWLINCFNEHCYDDIDNREVLHKMAYGPLNASSLSLRPGRIVAQLGLQPADMPGPIISMAELLARQPDHLALTYLTGRRLDPLYLGKVWDVSYCPFSKFPYASNRIIIPIYAEGMMVGWQARYIGDSVFGRPFNEADVPKYWSWPGYRKRLAPYNFDRAVAHPTVVLVEGPADAWKVGVQSIALIGKTMSAQAVEKLGKAMSVWGEKALVVILLDPKPDPKEQERGKPHHIEVLKTALYGPMRRNVVDIYLPKQFDPGSLDRDVVRDIIRTEAGKQGRTAYFGRPPAKQLEAV